MKTTFILFAAIISIYMTDDQEAKTFQLQHDHSNILVSNMDASALFYKNILHLKELETPWGPNPAVRFFSIGGNQQIHVVQAEKGDIVINKMVHMAFSSKDFDDYMVFLQDAGIEVSNFSGSNADPQIRPDGVRQIYFQDPDGNCIEVNDATY